MYSIMLNLKREWNRIKNTNVLIIGKSGTGKNEYF